MRKAFLSDEQWKRIESLMSRARSRGRPLIDNRRGAGRHSLGVEPADVFAPRGIRQRALALAFDPTRYSFDCPP